MEYQTGRRGGGDQNGGHGVGGRNCCWNSGCGGGWNGSRGNDFTNNNTDGYKYSGMLKYQYEQLIQLLIEKVDADDVDNTNSS